MEKLVIAIDGPSGTGKSTTAKLLAAKLDLPYVDSGAYYRSFTLLALNNKVKPEDNGGIMRLCNDFNIKFEKENIFLNGIEVTAEIRKIDVTNKVSSYSKIKLVRRKIVEMLREFAKENGIVMDGRDIGTVVFPEANYKFFLICDMKTRAARRQQDFLDLGHKIPIEKIMLELQKRDEIDTKRSEAPLKMGENAIEVDTTNMIIEEQVNFIYRTIINVTEE